MNADLGPTLKDKPSGSSQRRIRGIRLRLYFTLTLGGLAAALLIIFWLLFEASRDAVTEVSSQLQRSASDRVARNVSDFLMTLEQSVKDFEAELRHGVVKPDDFLSVERSLYRAMLGHAKLTSLSLTYGKSLGYRQHDDPDDNYSEGDIILEAQGRGQLLVSRDQAGDDQPLQTRHLFRAGDRWVCERRERPRGAGFDSVAMIRDPDPPPLDDPTTEPSFQTPARQTHRDELLWSDLAYNPLDETRPEPKRRKVLSVQKAIFDGQGRFIGVLRAAMLSDEIERIMRQHVTDDVNDQHRLFLCDTSGRLITRTSPEDKFVVIDETGKEDPDGDLRVQAAHLPPPLGDVMRQPMLRDLELQKSVFSRIRAGGVDYLLTLTPLPPERTQGWVIGIVVPETYYMGKIEAAQRQQLVIIFTIMGGILLGGMSSLRAIRRGFNLIINETDRVHRFDFTATEHRSSFREVNAALSSLEQAKIALRALGKYVPIDLVRQLFVARREPVLGSENVELSLMFTDIRGFTTIAETLGPDGVALALGRYLDVMTTTIQLTGGTIDKYIGDAVMALWNTPQPLADHSRKACQAALECVAATRALFDSPLWGSLQPWHTRFGIHRDTVCVGHFGAPNRMSFTAIGDGVNLASRLEGLNKHYGTTILVTETIRRAAGEGFLFRRLDRVAVKGKMRAVEVYELLGWRIECAELMPVVERYEAALQAYFEQRFGDALALLKDQLADDGPSRVLAERCRTLLMFPPIDNWDGIYVAKEK